MLICPALQLQLIDQIGTCKNRFIQMDKYIISIINFRIIKIIIYQFADSQVMQIFNWLIKTYGLEGASINHMGYII